MDMVNPDLGRQGFGRDLRKASVISRFHRPLGILQRDRVTFIIAATDAIENIVFLRSGLGEPDDPDFIPHFHRSAL